MGESHGQPAHRVKFDKNSPGFVFFFGSKILPPDTPDFSKAGQKEKHILMILQWEGLMTLSPPITFSDSWFFGFSNVYLQYTWTRMWKQCLDVHVPKSSLLTLLATISKGTKWKLFSCWTWNYCSKFLEQNFSNTCPQALSRFAEENRKHWI